MSDWMQETRREVKDYLSVRLSVCLSIYARREDAVDQQVLLISTVPMVTCKYIAYANLYQYIRIGWN